MQVKYPRFTLRRRPEERKKSAERAAGWLSVLSGSRGGH